jgi:hypothetical protein
VRRLRTAGVFAMLLVLPLAEVPAAKAAGCPDVLVSAIPSRSADAPSGAKFVRQILDISGATRESEITAALRSGNIPNRLRQLEPVTLHAGETMPEITICVGKDYLAVGSDGDFLRVPMGLQAAIATATSFGFILPTPRMVDAIHQRAEIRLPPAPLPAGDEMRSTPYYADHDRLIAAQRDEVVAPADSLVAGHKKDLVLTNRLWSKLGRVAIYGWHKTDGTVIQPLSTVHGARYADYSHGVRLVSLVAFVDGVPRSLLDLLQDPQIAGLITGEGPIDRVAELVRMLAGPAAEPGLLESMAARLAESVRFGTDFARP